MGQIKLTKTIVEAIKPEASDVLVWDSLVRGFYVKVTPTGKRVYSIYFRNAAGEQRRVKIGEHGAVTVDEARKIASDKMTDVAHGKDPALERKEKREAITMKEFSLLYEERHVNLHKKPSGARTDMGYLKNRILPMLGTKKLDSITPSDIQRLHQSMADHPGGANRAVRICSKMFNLGRLWGFMTKDNPCKGLQLFREAARKRYMSAEEVSRLAEVLHECEEARLLTPSSINAIRMLMLSGMRSGEVKNLRWSEVDAAHGCLNLQDSKTGQKTTYVNKAAVALLDGLPRVNEWCFPGAVNGQPVQELKTAWHKLTGMAKLENLRIHDLRHSFASVGANIGLSLPIIGSLLGHRSSQTTQRYAHIAADPIRAAADLIGIEFEKMMTGKGAEVVSIAPAPTTEAKAKTA